MLIIAVTLVASGLSVMLERKDPTDTRDGDADVPAGTRVMHVLHGGTTESDRRPIAAGQTLIFKDLRIDEANLTVVRFFYELRYQGPSTQSPPIHTLVIPPGGNRQENDTTNAGTATGLGTATFEVAFGQASFGRLPSEDASIYPTYDVTEARRQDAQRHTHHDGQGAWEVHVTHNGPPSATNVDIRVRLLHDHYVATGTQRLDPTATATS